jgi:hypothetical protein
MRTPQALQRQAGEGDQEERRPPDRLRRLFGPARRAQPASQLRQ